MILTASAIPHRPSSLSRGTESDLNRLERLGLIGGQRYLTILRHAVLSAVRRGRSVNVAIQSTLPILSRMVSAAMLTGALMGYARPRQAAGLTRGRRMKFEAAPEAAFDWALEWARHNAGLADRQVAAIRREYLAEGKTIAADFGQTLGTRLNKALVEVVSSGVHVQGGMRIVETALRDSGVDPDTIGKGTVETLVRTQAMLAYNAGGWASNKNPDVDWLVWGYEYVTVGDDRVRPTHEAQEGVRKPKDDPYWNIWWPPNGYNCRCVAEMILKGDKEAQATEDLQPVVEVRGVRYLNAPDKGFAFNPGKQLTEIIGGPPPSSYPNPKPTPPDKPSPEAFKLPADGKVEPVPLGPIPPELPGESPSGQLARWSNSDRMMEALGQQTFDVSPAEAAAMQKESNRLSALSLEAANDSKIREAQQMAIRAAELEYSGRQARSQHEDVFFRLLGTTIADVGQVNHAINATVPWEKQPFIHDALRWLTGTMGPDLAKNLPVIGWGYDANQSRAAYHVDSASAILCPTSTVESCLHEFGHHIERSRSATSRLARRFLHERTEGEDLTSLKELFPDNNFRPNEFARKDRFDLLFENPIEAWYTGKDYGIESSTELIAMGLLAMYRDPYRFARVDPTFCRLILAVLRGGL